MGGLEIFDPFQPLVVVINRRMGGLENAVGKRLVVALINRRMGGLEMSASRMPLQARTLLGTGTWQKFSISRNIFTRKTCC